MSSKHTPNWSQRVEERTPGIEVNTSKNTSFGTWKALVSEQISLHQYEGSIRHLELLHGWELDETPYSFVQKYVSRVRKIAARAI